MYLGDNHISRVPTLCLHIMWVDGSQRGLLNQSRCVTSEPHASPVPSSPVLTLVLPVPYVMAQNSSRVTFSLLSTYSFLWRTLNCINFWRVTNGFTHWVSIVCWEDWRVFSLYCPVRSALCQTPHATLQCRHTQIATASSNHSFDYTLSSPASSRLSITVLICSCHTQGTWSL